MLYDNRFKGFNSHPKLEGTHAILPPSNPAWLRYDREKLLNRLRTLQAAALGTEFHDTAARNIKRGIKLLECEECPILVDYVNDAVDFGMTPEQQLFYSFNCYGTADAIGFDEVNRFLRIHDLKTGVTKASEDQLYVYAALFCLEYGFKPFEIEGELRIYQGDTVFEYPIDRMYLAHVRDKICVSDDVVIDFNEGALG